MDVSLLRFMNKRVRIIDSHEDEEYPVIGINWISGSILLSDDRGTFAVSPSSLDIVQEDDDW